MKKSKKSKPIKLNFKIKAINIEIELEVNK